jgi:CubicO group peptidase (beta-lactamase class C family)
MLYTQGKTDCRPDAVGYDEQRLDVLNRHLQRIIDDGEIQCATYCVSRKGRVFAHGAIGKKSFRKDDNTPVQPDSVRYIASITKTFTAVAIMQLVENGLMRLDQPVGEILPQFNTPPYNGVTPFQLLTHTSGMHADEGCFENKYQSNYWRLIDSAYRLCEPDKKNEFDWISAALGTIGSGFRVKPDTEWAYCSFGFVVLGAVIEKLTGVHAHKYIEDNICKPLGLKDTVFNLTVEMAKRYIVTDEELEKYVNDKINGTYTPQWIGEKLNIPSTGGGLDGTSYDLNRFGNMVLFGGTLNGARILGRKAVERMTAIVSALPNYTWNAKEKERYYGIGFDMRNGPAFTFSPGTFMHEGSGACSLYIDPKEELVAAWIVPFAKEGWFSRALYNVQNIIWSGVK